MEDTIIALDLASSAYFSANETATLLLRALADGTDQAALAGLLVAEFDVDARTAMEDVLAFLRVLDGRGLLVHDVSPPI